MTHPREEKAAMCAAVQRGTQRAARSTSAGVALRAFETEKDGTPAEPASGCAAAPLRLTVMRLAEPTANSPKAASPNEMMLADVCGPRRDARRISIEAVDGVGSGEGDD